MVLAALVIAPCVAAAVPDTAASRKQVVRTWSARLNAYDNVGIARLFARPAVFVQAGGAFRLESQRDISTWHRLLPCAGRLLSITVKGQDATAVFRLANGKNRRCDAPGRKAAAVFRIRKGKIVSWIQVPVPAPEGPTA
jgi:hypothetical protein